MEWILPIGMVVEWLFGFILGRSIGRDSGIKQGESQTHDRLTYNNLYFGVPDTFVHDGRRYIVLDEGDFLSGGCNSPNCERASGLSIGEGEDGEAGE